MRPANNEPTVNVHLRAVSLLSHDAASAFISAERNLCAITFDATGGDVYPGVMLNHLEATEAYDAADYLIRAALDIINVNPSCGVLLVQADSPTMLSAYFIPDASLDIATRNGASLH